MVRADAPHVKIASDIFATCNPGRLCRSMQSSIRTEVLGGITTFLAMAYIIVVNPAILRAAGLPTGASTVATIVVASFGSFLMGVWPKRPIGGFVVIVVLLQRRVRGAILNGIAATAIAGAFLGLGHAPQGVFAMPFVGDYSLAPIALHLDIAGVLRLSFLPILLTLFLMSFLDTVG